MERISLCRKKVNLLLLLVLFCIVILGCKRGNNEYEQAMYEAKKAISDKEYNEAEIHLSVALAAKPASEEVKVYQDQLNNYQKALNNKVKKDYNEAVELLNEVIDEVNGSHTLINYAKDQKQAVLNQTNDASEEGFPDVEVTLDEQKTDFWSPEQSNELAAYMINWGEQMDQTYESYDRNESVDLYGIKVPQDILNGTCKMVVGDELVEVEWSSSGVGKTPYQLLEVYSDAKYQPNLDKHTYFFVLANGEPKVLVTQQHQGNNQNYLYFNETQNIDLSQAFYQITKQNEY